MASYFIRQGTFAPQGPFEEARIAGYIAQCKVRAGMEISADGQRWMPVEEHRLFAAAAPTAQVIPGPPPVRAVQAVEEVEVAEEISAAPAARTDRRPARRPRPAPASGGGGKAAVAVVGLLVVGGIAVMASKGGSKDADRTGSTTPSTTTSAPPVVEPPKSPTLVESKSDYRARWTRHRKTYWGNGTELNDGVLGGYRDEEVEAKVTEVSGRKPERTQTIMGRRLWYFACSDGLVQFVWWKSDLGMWHYEINDY